MSHITLTDAERDHFAAYLRQEAEQADGMAKAAGNLPAPVSEITIKRYRTEAAAYMMVVHYLTGWEKM